MTSWFRNGKSTIGKAPLVISAGPGWKIPQQIIELHTIRATTFFLRWMMVCVAVIDPVFVQSQS
jgi:hypothetical protein